ncbi:MAG: hypothetical protein HYR50_02080 [Candidatus Rokubacteria bacterium]|nr:hypothetical protein [Candidatus Rokubacteria bacterium]
MTAGVTPQATGGTTGTIRKIVNATDLGDSVLTESAGKIGLGTTTPLDFLHTRFTDGANVVTGYAVQNLSAAAGAYSGMLFDDQTGAPGQFQRFNNATHEYRPNWNVGDPDARLRGRHHGRDHGRRRGQRGDSSAASR